MTGEYTELLYPAVGGVLAQVAQNRAPISAVKFLGTNANRKAADILIGLAGTYGQKYIPSGSRSGMRLAAAGAVFDLAKTYYSEHSGTTSTTGADVAVLDYAVQGGTPSGDPSAPAGGEAPQEAAVVGEWGTY